MTDDRRMHHPDQNLNAGREYGKDWGVRRSPGGYQVIMPNGGIYSTYRSHSRAQQVADEHNEYESKQRRD